MNSPIEAIKKAVAENRTSDALSALLELSQNDKPLYDSILIISGEFRDLTSQQLKGTIDNSEATRRLNVIHDKILVALGAFDSAGRVLPGSVVGKKNSAAGILGKLTLLFGALFIIMMIIQINPFSKNRLIDLSVLRFIPLYLGLITFVGYVLALIVGSLKRQ